MVRLALLMTGTACIAGCILLKPYRDQFHDVYETHDAKGRLVLRKEVGYDCCEGTYEKYLVFDTTGNLLKEYGFRDGNKYANFFTYDSSGKILLEEYYGGGDTTHSFERVREYLSSIVEYRYYSNDTMSYFFSIDFSHTTSDTFRYWLSEFDSAGKTTKWIHRFADCDCSNGADQFSDTCMVYIQLENELLQTLDTIEIKTCHLDACGECETR